MEHQNWAPTVISGKNKHAEKGDKAVAKAMRDGKDVETIKKGLFFFYYYYFFLENSFFFKFELFFYAKKFRLITPMNIYIYIF